MKKILVFLACIFCVGSLVLAQNIDGKKPKGNPFPNFDFKNRANDHFLMQVGYEAWSNVPEGVRFKGVSRHFNAYVFYDMPFKTNPQWSAAIGAGVGTSHIFFDKTEVDLPGKVSPNGVSFVDKTDEENYKKYKMATTYLELPVELRWLANPMNSNKSFKVALGVKVGTNVSAMTKGKNLQTSAGQSIYGTKYIVKEKDRKFVNGTRFAGTLRVGYGNLGLHAQYSILPLFKSTAGPEIRPWGVGITVSGL